MQVIKISKWGNSQGIRIPKNILKQIGIENADDSTVSMNVDNGKLIIQKEEKESKLMKRFKDYDFNEYLNDKDRVANKGNSVGRELW